MILRVFRKHWSNFQNLAGILMHSNLPKPGFQDTQKKRVLVMVNSLHGGGAQRVACQLASGFAASFDVMLLYQKETNAHFPLDSRVQLVRMPVFFYDKKLRLSSIYVKSVKKAFRIDVSVSLLHRMNCRNVYSRAGERVIVSERNNPMIAYPEWFSWCQKIYDQADYVVFQTREVQNMFSLQTQAHSRILPNPVSVSCLAKGIRKPRIVNVARLHRNKNQALLIRAFAGFLPFHPEYTLSLYGAGNMRTELEALADELGIREHVFFHGHVESIHEQISDAGMFVLSSDTEGMPNALVEAMMMGLPCISTACTGAKEVIRDGWNGLLCEIGNVRSLTDAMMYMAEHPAEAESMRHHAMETADAFRLDHAICQWTKLVREV